MPFKLSHPPSQPVPPPREQGHLPPGAVAHHDHARLVYGPVAVFLPRHDGVSGHCPFQGGAEAGIDWRHERDSTRYGLAMTAEESYLLAVAGYELYRSVLSGGGGSLREKLRERMMKPQPGDVVLEVSTLAGIRRDRWDPDRIGRLVRTEKEDPEAREPDRWVVTPLHDPEREQGWQNATFIALPDKYQWAEGSPAPGASPSELAAADELTALTEELGLYGQG